MVQWLAFWTLTGQTRVQIPLLHIISHLSFLISLINHSKLPTFPQICTYNGSICFVSCQNFQFCPLKKLLRQCTSTVDQSIWVYLISLEPQESEKSIERSLLQCRQLQWQQIVQHCTNVPSKDHSIEEMRGSLSIVTAPIAIF